MKQFSSNIPRIWPALLLLLCGIISTGYSQKGDLRLQAAIKATNFSHPGFSAGVFRTFHSREGLKNDRAFQQEWRYGVIAGAYYHRRMQTGFYAAPTIEWVRARGKGFQYGFSLGAGYLAKVIPHSFSVSESGAVEKAPVAATHHFILIPGIRLGRSLSIRKGLPFEWFVKNSYMIQAPTFQGTSGRYLLEIGLTWTFKKA